MLIAFLQIIWLIHALLFLTHIAHHNRSSLGSAHPDNPQVASPPLEFPKWKERGLIESIHRRAREYIQEIEQKFRVHPAKLKTSFGKPDETPVEQKKRNDVTNLRRRYLEKAIHRISQRLRNSKKRPQNDEKVEREFKIPDVIEKPIFPGMSEPKSGERQSIPIFKPIRKMQDDILAANRKVQEEFEQMKNRFLRANKKVWKKHLENFDSSGNGFQQDEWTGFGDGTDENFFQMKKSEIFKEKRGKNYQSKRFRTKILFTDFSDDGKKSF